MNKELKNKFWKDWRSALLGKVPYIILSYIFYPFIKRTQTREKYHSGQGGWWNRQLWYMLNDDEVGKYGEGIDWNPVHVHQKGIDITTSWGKFKASYWFNVIRNKAYNRSLSNNPENPNGNYDVVELEIDSVTKNGEYFNPLEWAQWMWINKEGDISIQGDILSLKDSRIGEGKVWFHPNNRKDLLYCRWSLAKKINLGVCDWYITFQAGAWSGKYDIQFKNKLLKKLFTLSIQVHIYCKTIKLWKNLSQSISQAGITMN